MTRPLAIPEPLAAGLLILAVCLLSFGLQIPSLGFYWDDYASIYVYQKGDSFTEWFGGQGRPLGGLVSQAIWDALGINPLGWHGINFGLTLAAALLFWGILRLLWPAYRTQTTLIALLFCVYPSYHLRPVPISFQLIASLSLCLFSFWLGLVALRRRNLALALLAALLIPAYQQIYEQNLGYEALRPLVMGYFWLKNRPRASLWGGVLFWLPSLAVGLAMGLYRFVIFQPNQTYASYNVPIYLDSLNGWLLLFKLSVAAPVRMLTLDWVRMPWRVFIREDVDLDRAALLALLGLVAGLVYLWRFDRDQVPSRRETLALVLVSLVMMALLLFPAHMVGRVLQDGFNSRWALTPSPLAALALGWLLMRWLGSRGLASLVMMALVALGIAVQVGINQRYGDDWRLRNVLYWQLRWRAPMVEPGTLFTLVTPSDTFAFGRQLNDYEMTGQANLYYAGPVYPLLVAGSPKAISDIYRAGRPRQGIWLEVIANRESIFQDWAFDLDRMLVFAYDGGCLLTATPTTRRQAAPLADFVNLAAYHNPALITSLPLDAAPPVAHPAAIGPDPAREWCFYYQQIQWANQFGLIELALELAQAAAGFGPQPGHEAEWLPFIEAYNRAGDYTSAQALVYRVAFGPESARLLLCEALSAWPDPAEPIQRQAEIAACHSTSAK